VAADLAVVIPSIGRARAQETVESIAESARTGDVPVEIALAWQSPGAPPPLPDCARAVEVLPLGVSYAKNRALAWLSAPVVGFVDDDELVDPGWADGIVSAFIDNPEIGAAGCPIATSRVESNGATPASRRRRGSSAPVGTWRSAVPYSNV
jgi:Glycosyl transferase family 2